MRRITSVRLACLGVVVLASAQHNEAPNSGIRRLRASIHFSLDSPRHEHMKGLSDFLLADFRDEDETFWIDLIRRSAESMSLSMSMSMSMPNTDSSEDNGDGSVDNNGEGGDDNSTALSLDCDAVQAGTASTSGPSMELRADVNITFYTKTVDAGEVSKIVYTVMNDHVRFWLLGCDAPGRRLVEATMINAVVNETREAGTCDTNITDAACVLFRTPTVVIYTADGGNITSSQARLDDAMIRAYDEGLFAFDGVVSANVTDESSSPDPVGDAGSAQNEEGLSTPATAGISVVSVTALALLLLAALLVKRRRTSQDDESFAKQINGSTSTSDDGSSQDSSTELLGATKRLVVGDNQSLEKGSDDIVDDSATLKSTSLDGSQTGMYVHVCQPPKQGRFSFFKIGTPKPCNLYQITKNDAASRDDVVLDTVAL